MTPTIETAPQLFGRVDGDVAALTGKPQDAVAAFNRRIVSSRLREAERAEYAAAYNEAYELECVLQLSIAETWTPIVARGRAELESALAIAAPEYEGVLCAALFAGEQSIEWVKAEQMLSYARPVMAVRR